MTMYIEGFSFIRNSTVASFIRSTSPANVCCICKSSADEKHKHKLGLDIQRLERVSFSFREVIWKKPNKVIHLPFLSSHSLHVTYLVGSCPWVHKIFSSLILQCYSNISFLLDRKILFFTSLKILK